MTGSRTFLASSLVLLLGACSSVEPVGTEGSGIYAPKNTSVYPIGSGTWRGPEGTYVSIVDKGNGTVALEMQYGLEAYGVYDGFRSPEGIYFTRNGQRLLLRRAKGDETALRYLAGKSNCLMVFTGEGYCQD